MAVLLLVGLPLLGVGAVQLYSWRIDSAEQRGREAVLAEIEARSARQALRQRDDLRAAEESHQRNINEFSEDLDEALEQVETERDHNRFINHVLSRLRDRQSH